MPPSNEHAETGLPKMTDAEKAAKLLEGNFVNIGKKVVGGQTLNAGEVKLLEQIKATKTDATANAPTFAKNQTQLAHILGVSRKTIQRKVKLAGAPAPEANGSLHVANWKKFLETEGVIEEEDGLDSVALKAEQILLQNKRLKNKISIEQKEWVPRVVVRQVIAKFLAEAQALSGSSKLRIATVARVAPDTTQAAEEVGKELDQIWRALETSEWAKK
jgi:hypothetical protein